MAVCLGLDLGTTSVSAVAINESGHLLQRCTRPHRADMKPALDDQAEQSVEQIEQTARECLQAVTAPLRESPVCLGLTGQMHGFLLHDAAGQAISPLYTWQDRRCLRPVPGLQQSRLERLQDRLPDDIPDRLGCQIQAGYAIATLCCLHETAAIPSAAVGIADIANFIGSRLTQKSSPVDPTFAASWGVYHLQQKTYADEVLTAAGLPHSLFPEILPSGSALGTIHPTQATRWDLPADLQITTGLGDHQAAFLGAINHPDRELLLNIGTGGQLAWKDTGSLPLGEIEIRPLLEGERLCAGAELIGGNSYAWLVQQVRHWVQEFGLHPSDEDIYRHLEQSRGQAVLSQEAAPICSPSFRGTRTDPAQSGSLMGIGLSNFSLGHLAQAILTGIVDHFCDLYERAGQPVKNLQRVIVTGNFFEHHAWTAQRIADRWNVPVMKCQHAEQAACGAARLAGQKVGAISEHRETEFWSYEELAN